MNVSKMYELFMGMDTAKDWTAKKEYCKIHGIDVFDFVKAEYQYVKAELVKRHGRYKYFITFTLKDSKKLEEAKAYVEEMIKKRSSALGIIEFTYVVEHPDGNAHLHAYINTTMPLRKNRFNVYEKKYGFTKVDVIKQGHKEEVINYMSKEGDIKRVI